MKTKQEKLSKYNIIVPYKGIHLLYNQISGALMDLNSREYRQYLKIEQNKRFLGRRLKKALRKGRFLIPNNLDELKWLESVFVNVNKVSTDAKSLTIAPTDVCNLACEYCFENKSQQKRMNEDTQKQLMAFADNFIRATPTKTFHVTWYGGEPLAHLSCMENLSNHFAKTCKEENVEFQQNVISNGTLLTKPNIARLKAIDCKSFQITIDGIREFHNAKRPYKLPILDQDKCPKGTYDQIIRNIKFATEANLHINIRVNIDKENKDQYDELVKELKSLKIIGEGTNNTIYPARIHRKDSKAMPVKEYTQFNINAEKQSLPNCELLPFCGQTCMASQQYALAISQNGKITKCWHHVTDENFCVGDISNTMISEKGYSDEYSPFKDPECKECPVLPSCFGGCRNLNQFWEKGYEGIKYEGCGRERFIINEQIIALYEKQK